MSCCHDATCYQLSAAAATCRFIFADAAHAMRCFDSQYRRVTPPLLLMPRFTITLSPALLAA